MIPTGNPNISPTISDAKEIHVLIIEKTKGAMGSDEESFNQEDEDAPEGKEENRMRR